VQGGVGSDSRPARTTASERDFEQKNPTRAMLGMGQVEALPSEPTSSDYFCGGGVVVVVVVESVWLCGVAGEAVVVVVSVS
jgi:hypothetical protein